MNKKLPNVFIGLTFFVGLAVLLYPWLSNCYNNLVHTREIEGYTETVAAVDDATISAEFEAAKMYNDALNGSNLQEPFIAGSGCAIPDNYNSILNFTNGIIGYIQIPKIDVNLPIYHGTSRIVLEKGVGHMEMTSLPIGGEGNHSVLTGHSGLPSATLFTNLTEMNIGDEFYIRIINQTFAYQVEQIKVVAPNNAEDLRSVPGEDYVTLMTCTPYGINSHRLLMRGTRIPYSPTDVNNVDMAEEISSNYNWILVIIFVIIAAKFVFRYIYKRKR